MRDRIEHLKDLAEKASPGKWAVHPYGRSPETRGESIDICAVSPYQPHISYKRTVSLAAMQMYLEDGLGGSPEANAALIVALKNDGLDIIEELMAENKRLQAICPVAAGEPMEHAVLGVSDDRILLIREIEWLRAELEARSE